MAYQTDHQDGASKKSFASTPTALLTVSGFLGLMEVSNFIVWAVVVFGIGGFAIAAMLSAFRKPVAKTPFTTGAIAQPSIPISDTAMTAFISAASTFNAGDYRKALEQLTQVIEQEPNCAEAWHNIGLAYANVGDNNKAVRSFLKAGDAYDKQGTQSGIARIKQDLETLKANCSTDTSTVTQAS